MRSSCNIVNPTSARYRAAPSWCSGTAAWDAVPVVMVEYIIRIYNVLFWPLTTLFASYFAVT